MFYDTMHNPGRKTLCTAYGFGGRAHSVFCYDAGSFLGRIFDPGGFSVLSWAHTHFLKMEVFFRM